jgi:hypothetical protein
MKTKTKNTILAIIVSVVAIFVPAFIFEKYIEGIFFFVCHWLIREQFPRQYHHIVPSMCRLLTSVIFFFGVSFILPISASLISAIPICYFISWVGFTKKEADVYELKYMKLKEQLEKKKEFNLDTCTEEELVVRCRELRMSEENTNLCIELFIKKTKQKVIADRLNIEEKSVQMRKMRLKTKLNTKL